MLQRFENFDPDVLWVPVVDDNEVDPNFTPTRYRPMSFPRKDIEYIYKNYWGKGLGGDDYLPYFTLKVKKIVRNGATKIHSWIKNNGI